MQEVGQPPAGQLIGGVLSVQGAQITGYLLDRAFVGSRPVGIGDLVVIPTAGFKILGAVHALRKGRRTDDRPVIDIQLLGEIPPDGAGFRRGVSTYPQLESLIHQASAADVALVYARPEVASVPIGSLRHDAGITAHLAVDGLLGKHFAILGSTGSGKSCAVTVILSALLDRHPQAHILLIDPHDEYMAALGDRAQRLDPASLELPYWIMTFDELATILAPNGDDRGYAEAAILRDAVRRAKIAAAGDEARVTVDTPLPYRLSDLERIIEEAMGALTKPEGAAPFRHLLARLRTVRADPRYAFMFGALHLRDTMATVLRRLFRIPTEGRPVTLVDISAVPMDIVDVVVSLLCRLVFEFGLWSQRDAMIPLLVVCEEAHRYVPSDGAPAFEPSRRAIARIAKEGRKYGISLCLVSQRPAELSATSLSQCGTVIALRMSNDRDQAFVRNVLPDGSDWMISALPALGTGEGLVFGEGVSVPMRVRFTELPVERQPASQSPAFSRIWSDTERSDEGVVEQTVARWRALRR